MMLSQVSLLAKTNHLFLISNKHGVNQPGITMWEVMEHSGNDNNTISITHCRPTASMQPKHFTYFTMDCDSDLNTVLAYNKSIVKYR